MPTARTEIGHHLVQSQSKETMQNRIGHYFLREHEKMLQSMRSESPVVTFSAGNTLYDKGWKPFGVDPRKELINGMNREIKRFRLRSARQKITVPLQKKEDGDKKSLKTLRVHSLKKT